LIPGHNIRVTAEIKPGIFPDSPEAGGWPVYGHFSQTVPVIVGRLRNITTGSKVVSITSPDRPEADAGPEDGDVIGPVAIVVPRGDDRALRVDGRTTGRGGARSRGHGGSGS